MDTLERAAKVDISGYRPMRENIPTKRLAPEDVPKFIKDLEAKGTYGELTIRFRRGQITSVALTETYLLTDHQTGGNRLNEYDDKR